MKSIICVVPWCAVALGVGCSASGGGSFAGADAGPSPGETDADIKQATDPAALPSAFWLVNATSNLFDVRVCLFDGEPAVPSENTIPSTNFPGLTTGQAARVRANRGDSFTPKLYEAKRVAALEVTGAVDCATLSTLLPSIPLAAVTLPQSPSVLALTGCPANTTGDTSACGADYAVGTGNLRITEVPVAASYDRNHPVGVQVLDLSRSVAAVKNLRWGLGSLAKGACATDSIVSAAVPFATAMPTTAITREEITDFDASGLALCDADSATPILAASFTSQQSATNPAAIPAEHFAQRGNYVFTVVGQKGGTGTSALRVLALPFTLTM